MRISKSLKRPTTAVRSLASFESGDDQRSKLEKTFNSTTWLCPDDIRAIMLRTTRSVYDVEMSATHRFCIMPCTHAPEKETLQYMKKLRAICETVQKMGTTHIVKGALESLNGPVTEMIEIDLGVDSRLDEFLISNGDDEVPSL